MNCLGNTPYAPKLILVTPRIKTVLKLVEPATRVQISILLRVEASMLNLGFPLVKLIFASSKTSPLEFRAIKRLEMKKVLGGNWLCNDRCHGFV